MAKQLIVWTGLPNGTEGDKLRLTVFVTPQLYGDAVTTLADYPDFQAWPDILSGIDFSVTFTGGGAPVTVPAQLDPASDRPDHELWSALFSSSTPVTPYTFTDLSTRFVRSFQARNIHAFMKTGYQIASLYRKNEGATQLLPPDSYYEETFTPGQLGYYSGFIWSDDNMLQFVKPPDRPGTYEVEPLDRSGKLPKVDDTSMRLARVRGFHYRTPRDPVDKTPPPPLVAPKPDFHHAVAAMAQFSKLLRRLGLAIDVIVPSATVPSKVAGSFLQIQPLDRVGGGPWVSHSLPGDPIRPHTFYTFSGTTFEATPQSVPAGRMLDLADDAVYGLSDIDLDGAALKFHGFMAGLLRQKGGTRNAADTNTGMPALRTGGISLLHHGRGAHMRDAILKSSAHHTNVQNGQPPELHAEDLTRGYRIDVYDVTSGKWRSLCWRDTTYIFGALPAGNPKHTFTLTEEGFVVSGATEDPTATKSEADLYLHESLFRWNGWSLVAPMPGKALNDGDQAVIPDNGPGPDFNLQTSFAARSLPRLRFGHQYRFRARAVDLAGNSLPMESGMDAFAIPPPKKPPFTYRRAEPIPSPDVILRHSLAHPESPGEAVARLVIRSDYHTRYDTYPAYLASVGHPGFQPDSQRHLAPPRSSVHMAEMHGMFDTGTAGAINPNTYDNIRGTGMGFKDLDGALDSTAFGDTAFYDADSLTIPYLPDVMSRKISFWALPGKAGVPVTIQQPFAGTWPFLSSMRLQLVGLLDSDTPKLPSFSNNVMTVYLKQADVATFSIASAPNEADLNELNIWGWLLEYYNGAVPDATKRNVLQSIVTTLTPPRTLTVVHAVQRPLLIPKFATLVAKKDHLGQTDALLLNAKDAAGKSPTPMPIHGKSTVKLDVEATWQDPIDTGSGDDDTGFHTVHPHAHVIEVPVAVDATEVTFGPNDGRRHQLHDTKYHRVTYTAIATTRFREYFPFTDDEIATGKVSIVQTSPPVTVDVLNSSPPDAPNVLYVIPAFKWDPVLKKDVQTFSNRHGGFVRVYMDRPWFSSGDGELLGVLVPGPRMRKTPAAEATKVTQWGRDPLWRSAGFAGTNPTTKAFPLAVPAAGGLSMSGLPLPDAQPKTGGVDVAGHAVHFDRDRGLWYCDIQMTWGESYYPFIRFALARFQPNSLPGAHLSRVVQAEFVQLAPDRFATIKTNIDRKDLTKVAVTLAGPAYFNTTNATSAFFPNIVVTVSVEAQSPTIDGDLGWTPTPTESVLMQGSFPNKKSNSILWTAAVSLPRPVGTQPYRLVLREYEQFVGADGDASNPVQRLVYASSVEI